MSLSVDTGVTTIYIDNSTSGELQFLSTATNDRLPIVLGTLEQDIPSDCSISFLELLTPDMSWVTISHAGFELSEERGRTYVQVHTS